MLNWFCLTFEFVNLWFKQDVHDRSSNPPFKFVPVLTSTVSFLFQEKPSDAFGRSHSTSATASSSNSRFPSPTAQVIFNQKCLPGPTWSMFFVGDQNSGFSSGDLHSPSTPHQKSTYRTDHKIHAVKHRKWQSGWIINPQ